MTHPAFAALERGLKAEVNRWKTMRPLDRLQAVVDLAGTAELPQEQLDTKPIADLLLTVAGQGSLEAVGALVAIGAPEKTISAAIGAVASRSPDVMNGAHHEALVVMLEEWADAEVAAGRMTKHRCEKTGRWLYQTVGRDQ